jgi:hypothetical protein
VDSLSKPLVSVWDVGKPSVASIGCLDALYEQWLCLGSKCKPITAPFTKRAMDNAAKLMVCAASDGHRATTISPTTKVGGMIAESPGWVLMNSRLV